MKKFLKKIILIMTILILSFSTNYTYGFVKDDFLTAFLDSKHRADIVDWTTFWLKGTDEAIALLKENMGYRGNSLNEEMKLYKYFKIKEVIKKKNIIDDSKSKRLYKIQFGENDYAIKYSWGFNSNGEFNIDDLKKIFGLNESIEDDDLIEGFTWEANIIVKKQSNERDAHLYLESVYTGSDLNKIENVEVSEKESKNIIADNVNKAKKFGDTFLEFIKHPIGKPIKEFMNFLGETVGDNVQRIANLFQTVPEFTSSDDEILYSYSDLEKDVKTSKDAKNDDKGLGNRNKYTNVGKDSNNSKSTITVDVKKDKNENGEDDFTASTEIPFVVGDLYNIANGKIDFFDVNFLTGNQTKKSDGTLKHAKDSTWSKIRNIAAIFIHISIYVSAAMIILSLVWYGIQFMRHSFDDPNVEKESREGLRRFGKAILMLLGTVIIMALCTFGTNEVFNLLGTNDGDELPIRVNVEDTYSFSTTPTGYIRYMSLTEDIEEPLQKFIYTLIYIILALVNLVVMGLMFARMIILCLLSIIGPIIAVIYVFNANEAKRYRSWVITYIFTISIQIFITIMYTLIFNIVTAAM